MPSTRTYYRSFAGGEISPEMFGRIDDAKYQTGASTMLNFIALPQGAVENRPGLAFVREVKNSASATRLIPFQFSPTQTLVVEMGAGYFRFHTQGATVGPGTPAAYNGATAYDVGDLVSSGGVNYYCIEATTGNAPPNATYWYAMPAGILEIPNPYAAADLFDIHYVQSGDIVTLVHPSYAARELRRYGATDWTLTSISFYSPINSPSPISGTPYRGGALNITAVAIGSPGVFTTVTDHGFTNGDVVFIGELTFTNPNTINNNFYTVWDVTANTFKLKRYDTGQQINTATLVAYISGGYVQPGSTAYPKQTYRVTSVTADGRESTDIDLRSVFNNLDVPGSYNLLSWSAVSGAASYRIYKETPGFIAALIGTTTGTSFEDNNIAPDLGVTFPNNDIALDTQYPRAVAYYEQRRVFAGPNAAPQSMWFTESGTESSMIYHTPLLDTDRINIKVAARENNTIQHLVPLTQLLALTNAAEWRVSPINSDALTPTTISVRPQSYIGSNNVQPVVVNNAVVYCAARGGHVRELGYSWQSSGFITGDLSIRAAHLFDDLEIVDMCYAKAPQPLLWFVSTSGKLLGLTYIPEQQVGAWHQHQTDGAFESCTVVSEGDEDYLYVVVNRTIGGSTKRYVERMASRNFDALEDAFFVDSGLTYDGTNTTATTVTVTTGSDWTPAATLTITASATTFAWPATTDVGDVIVLTDTDGTKYRLTILSTSSTTVATARVDKTLGTAFRGVPTTTWAWARDTVGGLSHLEGKTVSILGDGAVMTQRVVSSGSVTLDRPATVVQVGLAYQSDLKTLPMIIQMEAFGQGRNKNLNKAYLRVYRSSGIFAGPSDSKLIEFKQRTTEPYGSPPALKTEEIGIDLKPSWNPDGYLFVRQSDPLPLTIVGVTLEVVIGG